MHFFSYLGRKILRYSEELRVEDTSSLVWPDYSYWTISYMLTYRGAWKLVQQNPLAKLVPVDEYLPIMYDKHPE
jgi:collagen beta-1,O-galactosyltransferase